MGPNKIENQCLQRWFDSGPQNKLKKCLFAFNLWGYIAMVPADHVFVCCHTGLPCRGHETWHPIPSHYTDAHTHIHTHNRTEFTCRCDFRKCWMLSRTLQLPVFKGIRPIRRITPDLTPTERTFWTMCYPPPPHTHTHIRTDVQSVLFEK